MSDPKPIDLRSDTVTRPTLAMRRAMADAVVGDDVFGDDPTVIALEERVSALTGKEASLFVPSGTMGNQLALHCLAERGDEVLLDVESHIFVYEQGGMAANSGLLAHPLPAPEGCLAPEAVRAAFREVDDLVARVTLACFENTHNRLGGTIVPLERMREAARVAREGGARVHLDGARLWNAEAATGIPLADWAEFADTVMLVFSKGLGAPVGSILAGSRDVVRRARRTRKRWGGGMRQVGVLAAAALHAIERHRPLLVEDHDRARRLAAGIRRPELNVPEPATNIVIVELKESAPPRDAVLQELKRQGVLTVAFGHRRIRAMTHLDVDDAQIERAARAFHEVLDRLERTPTGRVDGPRRA